MSKEQAVERLKENPLDRERWIEVGKAMGWDRMTELDTFSASGLRHNQETWKYQWHLFVDHLADGKDAESFFTNLLTQ